MTEGILKQMIKYDDIMDPLFLKLSVFLGRASVT